MLFYSMLLTHLYQYFGVLLGCSDVGMTGFPAYAGEGSQYNVHKSVSSNLRLGIYSTHMRCSLGSWLLTLHKLLTLSLKLALQRLPSVLPNPISKLSPIP